MGAGRAGDATTSTSSSTPTTSTPSSNGCESSGSRSTSEDWLVKVRTDGVVVDLLHRRELPRRRRARACRDVVGAVGGDGGAVGHRPGDGEAARARRALLRPPAVLPTLRALREKVDWEVSKRCDDAPFVRPPSSCSNASGSSREHRVGAAPSGCSGRVTASCCVGHPAYGVTRQHRVRLLASVARRADVRGGSEPTTRWTTSMSSSTGGAQRTSVGAARATARDAGLPGRGARARSLHDLEERLAMCRRSGVLGVRDGARRRRRTS